MQQLQPAWFPSCTPGEKAERLVRRCFFSVPVENRWLEQTHRRLILGFTKSIDPLHQIAPDQVARGKQNQFFAPALAAKMRRHVHESTALSSLIGIAPRPPVRRSLLPMWITDCGSCIRSANQRCDLPRNRRRVKRCRPRHRVLRPLKQQLAIVLPQPAEA